MSRTEHFEQDDFILGPDLPLSVVGTLADGEEVLRLTPVMVGSSGSSDDEFVSWDGSIGTAVGLTCFAEASIAGPKSFSFYNKGSFRSTSINWPAEVSEAQKQTAFAGAPISIG
ncbi:head decoration protein [Scandinavium goeteborgense]|uniref:head decoration protein n=1 Tax=Scandinavium goeteborgense TaxID=1851514 RepID=UPI0021668182|nr:head decoration protein [Scandinavium goeteborgense]MCS2152379.1 head decoration protein [Scandinavium goeteborgense]